MIVSALILLMPWTEYFWTFDRFLRGGQDLELGLLALASCIGLALVLSVQASTCLSLLLSIHRWTTDTIARAAVPLLRGVHALNTIQLRQSLSYHPLNASALPMRV